MTSLSFPMRLGLRKFHILMIHGNCREGWRRYCTCVFLMVFEVFLKLRASLPHCSCTSQEPLQAAISAAAVRRVSEFVPQGERWSNGVVLDVFLQKSFSQSFLANDPFLGRVGCSFLVTSDCPERPSAARPFQSCLGFGKAGAEISADSSHA